ncbi:MAG: sulfotransferase, partial [Promethearchaeota archaeon]
LVSSFDEPEKPVIFILGAPRSATTLLHQIIAESGNFGYISNYLARFWKAPYFGALQEKAFEVRTTHPMSFKSDYGRTSGWKEPHHFSYFWHRWFQFDDNHKMSQNIIKEINLKFFKQEIAALESVFNLPMVFRSLYCNLQVTFLKKALNNAKFIICLRNPLYQAQSILLGRKSIFGNTKKWFSLKPPEYFDLKSRNEYEQVTGQIFFILKAIEESLKNVNQSDYVIIQLEKLVENTQQEMSRIIGLINENEFNKKIGEKLPTGFQNRNEKKIDDKEWELLKEYVQKFFGEQNDTVPFDQFMLYKD